MHTYNLFAAICFCLCQLVHQGHSSWVHGVIFLGDCVITASHDRTIKVPVLSRAFSFDDLTHISSSGIVADEHA
jgi:hypothetical protein